MENESCQLLENFEPLLERRSLEMVVVENKIRSNHKGKTVKQPGLKSQIHANKHNI